MTRNKEVSTYAVLRGADGHVFVLCNDHADAVRRDSSYRICDMPDLPQDYCDQCARDHVEE